MVHDQLHWTFTEDEIIKHSKHTKPCVSDVQSETVYAVDSKVFLRI